MRGYDGSQISTLGSKMLSSVLAAFGLQSWLLSMGEYLIDEDYMLLFKLSTDEHPLY